MVLVVLWYRMFCMFSADIAGDTCRLLGNIIDWTLLIKWFPHTD